MTKTQMEAITAAFRSLPALCPTRAEQIGIDTAARALAAALEKTRKGFDRERFLRDCGVSS